MSEKVKKLRQTGGPLAHPETGNPVVRPIGVRSLVAALSSPDSRCAVSVASGRQPPSGAMPGAGAQSGVEGYPSPQALIERVDHKLFTTRLDVLEHAVLDLAGMVERMVRLQHSHQARTDSLERHVDEVLQALKHSKLQQGSLQRQILSLEVRLERIEKRLGAMLDDRRLLYRTLADYESKTLSMLSAPVVMEDWSALAPRCHRLLQFLERVRVVPGTSSAAAAARRRWGLPVVALDEGMSQDLLSVAVHQAVCRQQLVIAEASIHTAIVATELHALLGLLLLDAGRLEEVDSALGPVLLAFGLDVEVPAVGTTRDRHRHVPKMARAEGSRFARDQIVQVLRPALLRSDSRQVVCHAWIQLGGK